MSDVRLRQLERDAITGEVGARVRLLRERARAGTLDLERLRLGAWLGDADAREALGAADYDAFARGHAATSRLEVGSAPTVGAALGAFVLGLERWGKVACVRAAITAGHAGLRASGSSLPDAVLSDALQVLSAAEEWTRCPCDDHARAGRGQWGAALWAATASTSHEPRGAVIAAVHTAGWAARASSPARVRDSIRAALVPWALS